MLPFFRQNKLMYVKRLNMYAIKRIVINDDDFSRSRQVHRNVIVPKRVPTVNFV